MRYLWGALNNTLEFNHLPTEECNDCSKLQEWKRQLMLKPTLRILGRCAVLPHFHQHLTLLASWFLTIHASVLTLLVIYYFNHFCINSLVKYLFRFLTNFNTSYFDFLNFYFWGLNPRPHTLEQWPISKQLPQSFCFLFLIIILSLYISVR